MSGEDSAPAPSDPGEEADAPQAAPTHRYERQGLLGRGGMGQVYAARDHHLRRQVALKVAATPELAGRLAREAWITAQLEHPGIVAVYDAGETEGEAWYTMRLIRGRTLRERLADCANLPARLELLPHLHAACQAVAYAHAMGIVHRDLKPSNIMVGEFGETQVADWGLATPLDEARPDWQRIVGRAGAPAGTPRYMSPEQARGAAPSRQADVFGLGVALYELLGGAASASSGPPDADGLPEEVPRDLVAIARRCLETDPAARYPSAGELAAELGRWLAGRRVHAHDYRPMELLGRVVRAWRVPLAVAGVALLALAAVVAGAVDRIAGERATAEVNLAVALTSQALAALQEERLPEARLLAAHALALGPSIEARGVLAATERAAARLAYEVPLPSACRHSGTLAPDARALACHAEGRLELWDVDPFERRWTVDLDVAEAPVWVGSRLLVATSEALVWVEEGAIVGSIEGAGWWPLTSGDAAFAARGPAGRWLSPAGGVVQFEICAATRATTSVVAGELLIGCDDGVLRRYGPDGRVTLSVPIGERPAWSAVLPVGGGVLLGRLDGGVQRLALPEGDASPPLPGVAGSIRALQPVPGASSVLVLGERGGPRIWNPDVPTWGGSLPAGITRMFPGVIPGDVWLLGETLQRWTVSTDAAPMVFSFATGVSQAIPSPSAEALAVALGSGEVVEVALRDGRTRRRWTLGEGVAKGVAYADGGQLVAGAMGQPAVRLGATGVLHPLPAAPVARRVGRLADGRVWALSYRDAVHLIAPGTDAVTEQVVGPGPFDGSSSPAGTSAAILDNLGGVWLLDGATWREAGNVPDAVAVDVGEGDAPLVVARQREVCVGERCTAVDSDVIDVSVASDRIAVAMLSGDVMVLRASSGEKLALLRGHRSRVSSVELAPEGTWLVSGSWDGTARIWDLASLDSAAGVVVAAAEGASGLTLAEAMRGR